MPLVQDPVAATAHAVLEDLLLFAVRFEPGAGAAINGADPGRFADVASIAHGARRGADRPAQDSTLADALRYHDFFGVRLALFPIFGKSLRINAFGIYDRVGMRGAARKQRGDQE